MNESLYQSRRKFLKDLGYVSIGFSLLGGCVGVSEPEMAGRFSYEGSLPGSLKNANKVNAWLEILADGRLKVYSGKVELGQGIRTAIKQVAAEELDLDLEKVEVHLAETGVTPNEGYTGASASIRNSAMSVRYAAATARGVLLELASEKLKEEKDSLILKNSVVTSSKNDKSITFLELLDGVQIKKEVLTPVPIKNKDEHRYVGKPIARTDIRKMVVGEQVYVHDLRFPEMVHARIVRPPNYNSTLLKIDESKFQGVVSGFIKTVVNGNFIGVITKEEYQAVKAERILKVNCEWNVPKVFPEMEQLYNYIRQNAQKPENIRNEGHIENAFKKGKTIRASFTKPYIKHASMGPACAIARYDGEILHIWSHSQGIYPLREGIANMLDIRVEKIHIIGVPGAGCFGHSTADDAAADVAVLALAYPNKHIRLQWSRQDEFKWDPFGSAIISEIEASLDDSGKIEAWKSDVWTDSHSTRPNSDSGTLLTARYLENPIQMKSQGYLGGGHRNGSPNYTIPNLQLNAHYFKGPLRVSSLRSLGSFANVFAIESFIDILAESIDKAPLIFRLAHLNDSRAIEVLEKVALLAKSSKIASNEGIGYGFMRYKNSEAYIASAVKVNVDKVKGHVKILNMWAAIDVGEVINPDGIKNQIEGGMIQAASWTLKEQVQFNDTEIKSSDWSSYPIMRYVDIPQVKVEVIDRPEEPALGAGEIAMPPTCAAIANAVYRACGKRICNLPITSDKILG